MRDRIDDRGDRDGSSSRKREREYDGGYEDSRKRTQRY